MKAPNQEQHPSRVRSLEVSAFRYSADPRPFAAFLELLGLSPRVSNKDNSWLEMQAAAGSVSIHAAGSSSSTEAEPGRTDLVLIAPDVATFAAGLAGHTGVDDVVVWDEAFGRQAAVTVGTRRIIVNESQTDPYGYQVHDPKPGPVTVVSHYYTTDFDTASELFAVLGLQVRSKDAAGDEIQFETAAATGVVVLHRSQTDEDRYTLGFELAEDLAAVAARLREAGYPPRPAAGGQQIEVIDPDGQSVTITTR